MNLNSRIVIVGGGFGGARAAQALSKGGFTDVTLIDRKRYFEVTFATLRGVTEPDNWGKRSRIEYQDFLKSGFVQASVSSISSSQVVLESGETIAFDNAIVATGSSYPSFSVAKSNKAWTISAREAEFQQAFESLSKTQSAMIIGGGAVGVEFAGELADHFPEMAVKLVHGDRHLLSELSPKAGARGLQKLASLGVEVHLNTRLKQHNGEYLNQNGAVFSAEQCFECWGAKANNQILQNHFHNKLDDHGRLKVDALLRVEGCKNIYALGDIANIDELKVGYLAGAQAEYLAKSMLQSVNGKRVKPYKTNPKMALVPVGRSDGLVQLPFAVTSLKFMLNMKQKDLFIAKVFKGLDVAPGKYPLSGNDKVSTAS